ncbi:putative TPR repeat methyltransferase [Sphingomonas sp. PvP055]|uniref:tetratricopeptide repeat protein n=1 Tax=Sphingomonas sp. PvP055 TaxID=3156391 RepID=UPI00339138F7
MGLIADRLRRLLVALGIRRRLTRRADRARDARAFAEAAALYERVLRLTPQDARIHIQAGHMAKEAGDPVGAERHYRAAIAAAPEDRDARRSTLPISSRTAAACAKLMPISGA